MSVQWVHSELSRILRTIEFQRMRNVILTAKMGSVDYAECGVWKIRSVENEECGKC